MLTSDASCYNVPLGRVGNNCDSVWCGAIYGITLVRVRTTGLGGGGGGGGGGLSQYKDIVLPV